MAITLTTPVNVVNNLANINKLKAIAVRDYADVTPPYAVIMFQAQGGGGKTYPGPGQNYVLTVTDRGTCQCLFPNPASTGIADQFLVGPRNLTGTPYTTIMAAYYDGGATGAAHLRAAETACLSTGLLDAAFAGTVA